MDFETLLKKISPRLKRIAKSRNGHGFFIDKEDLYQEMCIHLWNHFKDGVPAGINDAYIVKGCKFHILNYLRKEREKARIVSLEAPINEYGGTLKDILPDTKEPLDKIIDRHLVIEDIKNNGFTKREKEVFSFILGGYTVRETGKKLDISHVMVVKYKQRIMKKWWNKCKTKVTKNGKYLLL
ncbi:MAG: sigma-70 family RNA polymerase sigma factor [Candidatus Omnitrophica bacterium]|nr:sigma-70 family RNA polymerase sigma factor [Candidatus Omnitrophota bacterium]